MLGLDNSGKTILTYAMNEEKLVVPYPTFKTRITEFDFENFNIKVFDLGGSYMGRRLWSQFYAGIDGAIFVVDASDTERFDEAKDSLHQLLTDPQMNSKPIVVLGNKIDIRYCVSEARLRSSLGLTYDGALPPNTIVELFMCSIVKRVGYKEGLKWLCKHM